MRALRGSGRSRVMVDGWTTADMAADVHHLAVALGLRRPAVAGISMAGTSAGSGIAPDLPQRGAGCDLWPGLDGNTETLGRAAPGLAVGD